MRKINTVDSIIIQFNDFFKVLFNQPISQRPDPSENITSPPLNEKEIKHAAGLMRVNHAGEMAAQGLYQGQSLTAKLDTIHDQMQAAANEEKDHLAWCHHRLNKLNAKASILNPIWYSGAFMIGAIAGLAGDKWSLAFVVETEKQVVAHLEKHLGELPENDLCSRAVIEQMQKDEAEHAKTAEEAGARELPLAIKKIMSAVAKIMTVSAYYL